MFQRYDSLISMSNAIVATPLINSLGHESSDNLLRDRILDASKFIVGSS
jgi:hypothetical protein